MNGTQTQPVNSEQFLRFNEQLLGLVRARVPLDHGLAQVASEMSAGRLRDFTAAIADDLKRGRQLSEAIEPFKGQVSDYYVALIRAGEKGGSLAEILHHVVHETRRQIEHRRVLTTSLAYPAMVLGMSIVIYTWACFMIVPKFVDMYAQLGAELPWLTQAMVRLFWMFETHLLVVVVLVAILAVAFVVSGMHKSTRPFRHALALNFPVIGNLVYNDVAISFSRCLGFLLQRGVAMTDALTLTQSAIRNVIAGGFVGRVRDDVTRGERFSDAVERQAFLPPSTRWMIRLSEDRGDLDKTLLDIADFYQMRNEQLRRTLGGLVEPALIIALGVAIGTLVISLYLPLFTIPTLIR